MYSEFRARIPRIQGSSSYEYMYCLGGEALAFVACWLTLLRHVITTACVARAVSQNIDAAFAHFQILNATLNSGIGIGGGGGGGGFGGFGATLDFLGFLMVLIVMVIAAAGVRLPSHRIVYAVQMVVSLLLLFVVVFGAFKTDFSLWKSPEVFFEQGARGVSHSF